MLLKFYAQNYRSFKDGFEFSMEAVPGQKELSYSILSENVAGKKFMALSSGVIYGPNASGKTNIIGAMDTMRSIVLRGNIRDAGKAESPNIASSRLSLIPFADSSSAPVVLGVVFIHEGLLIEYSFTMDIGGFVEDNYPRKIVSETLWVNQKEIFSRAEKLSLDGIQYIQSLLNGTSSGLQQVAENSLISTDLFLANGFKSIYSTKLFEIVTEWFSDKFMVVYQMNDVQLVRQFANAEENTVYIETTLTDAAKEFGIHSNALGFTAKGSDGKTVLSSIIKKGETGIVMPAEVFESYGTVRFINEFPLVIRALKTGSVLIVDEFDASIHPMALMNIIRIFHNDDINIHHAQLIFNTHNPIFLNAGLYRRDEIKFVERDDETHISSHYSLSDFYEACEKGRRKQEDYMKNYFISQYGAIKDIDFSSILEKIVVPDDAEVPTDD